MSLPVRISHWEPLFSPEYQHNVGLNATEVLAEVQPNPSRIQKSFFMLNYLHSKLSKAFRNASVVDFKLFYQKLSPPHISIHDLHENCVWNLRYKKKMIVTG